MGKFTGVSIICILFAGMLIASAPYGAASAQEEGRIDNQKEAPLPIKAKFDEAYRNWQTYCDTPDVMYSSLRSTYVENEPFGAIINLGPPALPFIMEKLQKDKDNDWQGGDFLLWYAVKEITGVDLEQWDLFESEPEIVEKYIQWWHENKASWSQGHAQ
ncbi:hypothetical protein Dalk_3053 [Desulfatibacillum aliphaticivorans]|uniref:Uncharacterized protein n=1 Tax=Desulfatibacillum aliphaticivorans TaxID=218208 RepID=B8FBJ0_DESAL|nr:hypothetical protein [Desulfatibacillum aliphaticivorans]ACL04743.1 hypothetical protein Dalk_3053 [Desulfatibacillum aliphaticivorans]